MTRITAWVAAVAFAITIPLTLSPSDAIASDNDRPTAQTKNGRVIGRYVEGPVAVYKAIPYAEPPVGPLRWQPPHSVRPWKQDLDAHGDPPGCMQTPVTSRLPWTEEFMHHGPVNEDCLYLNVWTPARTASGKLPVLVFIHGGGFTEGSVTVPLYDGAALARKGLVVVTLNYRLGVFGLLAHPELTKESPYETSGNYGFLDQVAALQWVRDNIAAFGGDAKRVTISGQSAGAMSVYLLTASSLAKGLFHRAIVQSGPGALASFGVDSSRALAQTLREGEALGVKFSEAHGGASIQTLRELDAATLMKTPGPRLSAVIDGWFLQASVADVYAKGQQNDVPMLIGMTADEASAFGGYDKKRAALLRRRGIDALTQLLVERAATAKTPAYVYYFERAIPWPEQPRFGAFHSGELPYVFDNLELLARPWTGIDRSLARSLSSYWVNFATQGDPNGTALPAWPAHTNARSTFMVFGDRPSARTL